MQGLPLRGHRDDNTAMPLYRNHGTFMAILENIAKIDLILKDHLQPGKKHKKCTSTTVQNEMINIIAECLRERVLEPMDKVRYYSIMADEVTYRHGNQNILSICVRFLDTTVKILASERPSSIFLTLRGLLNKPLPMLFLGC